ncbi:hypothetical protein M1105_01810 [Limibaculum sp. FT325]|uniref:hypothetical protein n=1 Tax=Thermohalobaculum sediminis TaxID=2939436 RepID=UPI0020BFE52B|nr:hypothetical protein [Limibaculum sediminis]MCL5775733.1 hypothetical protein [Limibaculum sediminis]
MDATIYGLIEIVVFFGGILAFCLWQLRVVRRSIAEDKARNQADGGQPAPPARRSAEDVFWDTVARPPRRD